MTAELNTLVWVLALQLVMWVPYILNVVMVRGLVDAVGYPDNPKPMAGWAQRMKAAHSNAVENLVVFVALLFVANATGVSNDITVLACTVYFWARVVHFVSYTLGIPWVRTLSFAVAWAAMVAIALQLL
jgi:uncharacterized MAPEG superfamily protein